MTAWEATLHYSWKYESNGFLLLLLLSFFFLKATLLFGNCPLTACYFCFLCEAQKNRKGKMNLEWRWGRERAGLVAVVCHCRVWSIGQQEATLSWGGISCTAALWSTFDDTKRSSCSGGILAFSSALDVWSWCLLEYTRVLELSMKSGTWNVDRGPVLKWIFHVTAIRKPLLS